MNKNKSTASPLIILVFVLLLAALGSYNAGNTAALLLCVGIAAVSVLAAGGAKLTAAKKTLSAKARAHEPQVSAKPDRGGDRKEALRCTCSHGRQRYLDQAEMFLKNGIIDKTEYNLMRERYLKMDIPDDL